MDKIISLLLVLVLSSCLMGKDYQRPETEKSVTFKEAGSWKQAEPKDSVIKPKWWESFGDKELNILADQVVISNQNIKAAEASYRQAQALVTQARSALFPTIALEGNAARNKTQLQGIRNNYNVSLATSGWEIDVWGRIRRSVEASEATANASEADLAAATLSAQSDLVVNYFSLRIADEQKRLLASTVNNYERSLELTQNLYNAGVGAKVDLLQAKTQLDTARAQMIDIDNTRAKLEHAIAILMGKAPANFTLAATTNIPVIPGIPVTLPSALLERRPDIAAAERRMIAANANIGVAKAAYFPNLLLSASGGYESNAFSNLFSLPQRVWSIGPTLAQTVFDAGFKFAQTRAAVAAYDVTVANYRQTVLSAFGEVEDNLAALTVLGKEAEVQQNAVSDAEATSVIFLNQYKSGIVSYLSVVTAQNTEFNNKLNYLNIVKQRLIAAAGLIKALGGGWDATMPIKK